MLRNHTIDIDANEPAPCVGIQRAQPPYMQSCHPANGCEIKDGPPRHRKPETNPQDEDDTMKHVFSLRRRLFCAGIAAPMLSALPLSSRAQSANRPLTVVVPYPPGGGGDINGRIYAERLGNQLGEKVVVENRAGANGTLGAAYVMSSPPDGRTLLFTYGNLLINQQFLMADPKVNPLTDLVPITRVGVQTSLIIVNADAPMNDLREFIALARKNPGKYTYAYYGDLGIAALAAEAGLQMVRVPYKGGVPGMLDVAGGRVDIIWSSIAQSSPLIKAGKLKVLASSGDKRTAEWPNAPTIIEVLPKYRALDYTVVLAPKGTPKAIAEKLYEQSAAALSTPEVRQKLEGLGSVLSLLKPDELLAFMHADYAALAVSAKAAGIVPE